jgi:hypothetical protein
VESGVLELGEAGWLHEAVGVVAFAMTALGLYVIVKPRAQELA